MKALKKARHARARVRSKAKGMVTVMLAGLGTALASGCTPATRSATEERLGKPTDLRCEYLVDPLGIDVATPRLSWYVTDARRGAVQSACQVIVATDGSMADARTVVWDTGKVASDQSVQVPYAGKALESGTRYFWKVRTWDAAGQVSEYSDPAWWEMGLLKPADWSARWIAPGVMEDPHELRLAWGQWIWNDQARGDNKAAYFRVPIDIDPNDKIEVAVIRIAADNRYVVYANGRAVGEGQTWERPRRHELTTALRPGKNIIAVKAENADGAFGLLATIGARLASGKIIELRSGSEWKSAPEAPDAWNTVDFDDSAWTPAVVVANYGDEPWKELQERAGPQRSQCLRKEFTLKPKVAQARAYVTGLGLYELHVNGQRVGEDIFTPGWTSYFKRIQYQAYDVTNLLREGPNAVGAIVGNGWWSGGLGWSSEDRHSHGCLRFLLQLNVEYADGTRESIVTDDTWHSHPSPITEDTFYHGETHDARLEMPGWDAPGFDTGRWTRTAALDEPLGCLVAQRSEPIRVTQELPAMQVSQPDPGVYIFDFGQNASGRARLKVKGPAGTQVQLRFGEELDPNGRLYRENYRSARATDRYILTGQGLEIWEPRFTYRGFRYCEVTGWPQDDPKNPQMPPQDALVFRVLHSAVSPAGTFECSHWLLNRIYQNVVWGQRSNLHSVPTDCPQRDERLGWTGDAQAFGHTSCFNMDMAAFYSKWMFDLADSRSAEGAVTDVAPAAVVQGAAKPGWGDAVVIIPWTVYRFYDDRRIIEQNYEPMVGWVEYMRSKSKDNLYETPGYGDWVPVVPSPAEWIGSAYYYYSTKLLSQMAAAIGRTDDARSYGELADKIASAFNEKHLNKQTNNYGAATQTCNILPLYFGITAPERRAAVLQNIVDDIKARGDHLSTGFLGTTYLMKLLADNGQQDLAYRLATQTTYPSWGHMVLNGATTIWERWDTDKQGPGMNSRNHFAFGTVGRWMFEDLAGVKPDPDVPGFKRFIIQPRPAGELLWAKAIYRSMYGPIHSTWTSLDDKFTLLVRVPPNTSARVVVPTRGGQSSVISESGAEIFAGGKVTGTCPGVAFVRIEADGVALDVAAGSYGFVVSPP